MRDRRKERILMDECAPRDYRSVQYFADLLRVSKRTILNMVNRGELEGAIRVGGVIRIPTSALDSLRLSACSSSPSAEKRTC